MCEKCETLVAKTRETHKDKTSEQIAMRIEEVAGTILDNEKLSDEEYFIAEGEYLVLATIMHERNAPSGLMGPNTQEMLMLIERRASLNMLEQLLGL